MKQIENTEVKKDVFEDYTEEERNAKFGIAPATVWQNLQGFSKYPEKVDAISGDGSVFSEASIESYTAYALMQWKTELHNRVIPDYMRDIREYVKLHGDDATDYDIDNWAKINSLKFEIAKKQPFRQMPAVQNKRSAGRGSIAESIRLAAGAC